MCEDLKYGLGLELRQLSVSSSTKPERGVELTLTHPTKKLTSHSFIFSRFNKLFKENKLAAGM